MNAVVDGIALPDSAPDIEALPVFRAGDRCPRPYCRGRVLADKEDSAVGFCYLCARGFPLAGSVKPVPLPIAPFRRVTRGPSVTEARVVALARSTDLTVRDIADETRMSRRHVYRIVTRERAQKEASG